MMPISGGGVSGPMRSVSPEAAGKCLPCLNVNGEVGWPGRGVVCAILAPPPEPIVNFLAKRGGVNANSFSDAPVHRSASRGGLFRYRVGHHRHRPATNGAPVHQASH